MDNKDYKGVDYVASAEDMPFKDNRFDFIHSHNCMQLLEHPVDMLKECWRVAKPKARIKLKVPHFTNIGNYLMEGNYKTRFASITLDAYVSNPRIKIFGTLEQDIMFKKVSVKITFSKWLKLVEWLVDKCQYFWERFIKFPPASLVIYELEVNKNRG